VEADPPNVGWSSLEAVGKKGESGDDTDDAGGGGADDDDDNEGVDSGRDM